MKKIADSAALFLILAVCILTAIAIFGVWELMNDDVIGKAFASIGLLSFVAVLVIVAEGFVDRAPGAISEAANIVPSHYNPTFTPIRHTTIRILIGSAALLALFGILGIWEVLTGEVFEKSITSIGVVAFSSVVIVVTCLNREGDSKLKKKVSGMGFLSAFLVVWIFMALLTAGLS